MAYKTIINPSFLSRRSFGVRKKHKGERINQRWKIDFLYFKQGEWFDNCLYVKAENRDIAKSRFLDESGFPENELKIVSIMPVSN